MYKLHKWTFSAIFHSKNDFGREALVWNGRYWITIYTIFRQLSNSRWDFESNVLIKHINLIHRFMCSLFFKLEIFDHTSGGILALLNDECLLPNSSTERFVEKLRNFWNEHRTFVWSKQSSVRPPTYHFTIRHFSGDVTYSTVWR